LYELNNITVSRTILDNNHKKMKKPRKLRKLWSGAWKASKKPKKQRKYRSNAPLHVKQKLMGCHLSPELRKKYGLRAIPIRKGDKVKVLRGSSKKKTGKVDEVNLKRLKVSISGVEINKKDGSKVKIYFAPSNLMITDLDMTDKRRKNMKKTKKEE